MIIKAKLDQPENSTKINNDICFARKRRSFKLQNSSSVTSGIAKSQEMSNYEKPAKAASLFSQSKIGHP